MMAGGSIMRTGGLALGALALAALGKEVSARKREASLVGNVAVITGGSRGLGLAIARQLAEEGCRLALCSRDAEELRRAEEDLRQRGATAMSAVCDVASEEAVTHLVDQVLAQYGRIDLLVTVAGIIEVGPVADMDVGDFRKAMDVMFWGTLYPIMAVLPGMRQRRSGRIALVTSIGGKVSVPRLLPYGAAKFAAVGLGEGLAAELARDGIHVTTIVPGLMRTGSHLNARFKGSDRQQRGDYAWFSVGATMPLAARADRAARIIVRAIKRGERERIYTLPFSLVSRVHGLAPALTIRVLEVVNRVLPRYPSDNTDITSASGGDVSARIASPMLHAATALGREAAAAFNQPRPDQERSV